MKYCKNCGKQIDDSSTFCCYCGANQNVDPTINAQAVYNQTQTVQNGSHSTLALIAFILCIISTVSMGFLIIPLAWCIPLTIKVYNSYKNDEKISTGVGVCILLFVNLISGILVLVDDNNK